MSEVGVVSKPDPVAFSGTFQVGGGGREIAQWGRGVARGKSRQRWCCAAVFGRPSGFNNGKHGRVVIYPGNTPPPLLPPHDSKNGRFCPGVYRGDVWRKKGRDLLPVYDSPDAQRPPPSRLGGPFSCARSARAGRPLPPVSTLPTAGSPPPPKRPAPVTRTSDRRQDGARERESTVTRWQTHSTTCRSLSKHPDERILKGAFARTVCVRSNPYVVRSLHASAWWSTRSLTRRLPT